MEIIQKKKNEKYQIMWATGSGQYDSVKEKLKHNQVKNVEIVPYIYHMEEVMNVVDLVICRSGAMTITEIAMLGKPAIFIPFPYAAENHQEYNARVLEQRQAAKIILDKELTAEKLEQEIENIICDQQVLQSMQDNTQKSAIYNAIDKIYGEVKKLVKEK